MRILFWALLCNLAIFAVLASRRPAYAAMRIAPSPGERSAKRKMVLGAWQLEIERGKFSGDIACHLHSRDRTITYVANGLGFHFGRHVNVMQTWFRLDYGEPRRWRE